MRIAVSGTHFMGKSTLIEDFISGHSEYIHEEDSEVHKRFSSVQKALNNLDITKLTSAF